MTEAVADELTHEQVADAAHRLVDDLLGWVQEELDLNPMLDALMICSNQDDSGPSMILPYRAGIFGGLMIWLTDEEGLDYDQQQWYANYMVRASGHEAFRCVWVGDGDVNTIIEVLREYIGTDYTYPTRH